MLLLLAGPIEPFLIVVRQCQVSSAQSANKMSVMRLSLWLLLWLLLLCPKQGGPVACCLPLSLCFSLSFFLSSFFFFLSLSSFMDSLTFFFFFNFFCKYRLKRK